MGEVVISVFCSTYNSSFYIDNYLSYLNEQTFEEFEVIFIDAKSTDDSLRKIKDYSFRKGITKKVIECEKRIGIYTAWNLGVKESSSDYVMNYNADDKLYPNALTTLYSLAVYNPHVSVIYSNCFMSKDATHNEITGNYNWNNADNIDNLLSGCCCGPFPLLKKEAIVKEGMFNDSFTISGDYEMWCRLGSKGYRFLKTDEMLGVFYNNPEGASTKQNQARFYRHLNEDRLIRHLYENNSV